MPPLGLSICAAVVLTALLHLIRTGYDYSAQFEAGGRWDGYAPGLRQGWLWGRRVDLSDTQWRDFRSAAPALSVVLIAFAGLSRAVVAAAVRRGGAAAAVRARATFCVAFAAMFLGYLHGVTAVYVFVLVTANWALTHAVAGSRFGAVVIWGANIATLIGARLTDGAPPSILLGPRFAWLDAHRGAMRWHICYNLTVLRMLSFALDLHWARRTATAITAAKPKSNGPTKANSRSNSGGESGKPPSASDGNGKKEGSPGPVATPTTARTRQTTPLPLPGDYGLLFALAHALYPPLYLAGPIITYQDFTWQLKATGSSSSSSGNGGLNLVSAARRCAWRLVADVACIEVLTHTLYFNSLAVHRIGRRYAPHGLTYGPAEVGLTAWWVLSFMWLKFAVLWRIFRLGALLEGTDPPENMVRCFANNVDIEGFWKGWHASYNRWLVRYMYVPMGGARFRALSIWPIFLFVALWHDLEWRLLSWAWLICAAFLPELAVKKAAKLPSISKWRGTWGYAATAAALAGLNCAGLMAANMVGFVVGPDGAADLVSQLVASPRYIAAVLVSFYCAMHLNFAWREREAGQGRALTAGEK